MNKLFLKTTLCLTFILAFSSCNGQQTATSAKTSPSMNYEQEGVNTKHLFIFSDTTMSYNGKPFMPGMTIEQMCEIFGKYDRVPVAGIYVWDSLGLRMTTWSAEDPNTNQVNGLLIDWNIVLNDWGLGPEYEDKELREQCPRSYFKGNIIVGGAPLGRGMQIKDFLKRTTLQFNNKPFPTLHYCNLLNWDYTKAPIKKEKYYTYLVVESDNQENIEGFNAAISTR